MLFKNVASQKCLIFAYNSTTGAAVTGDTANITAYISKDGATGVASNDVNPAPITNMAGFYAFDLTDAETNCDLFALYAVSATGSVLIAPVIAYTTAGSVPKLVAGAAGGLFIAGSNAATTVATWTCTAASTNGTTVLGNTTIGTVTQTGAASWGATTYASMTLTSGTIPVDVQTIKARAVTDVGLGNTVYLGTAAWSTLTQTQVSGGAYDLTNATYVAALKSGLGTVPASGNWNVGKTGYALTQAFPTNFSDLNISVTTGLVRPDMANASGNYAGTVATVTTVTGGATAAEVAKIVSAMVLDGAVYQFTANALELAPSGGLDAAGVRTAIGMASADLDTQLGALPTSAENADALLGRNIAGGSSTGRTVSQALYKLRNKWSTTAVAGYALYYLVDDATESWRELLTSDAAGEPITGADPTT